MELNVQTDGGVSGKTVTVSDKVFGGTFKEVLVHQVVTAYMAGARAGTKAQKTRAEVRGGGAKPWRQKGTGRARAGSNRSPLWRGGGMIFAAEPRRFDQKVNKKMYRGAVRSILAELIREGRLQVVDSLTPSAPKTKELVGWLQQTVGIEEDVLLVTGELDERLELAARNLPKVGVLTAVEVDPVSLIGFDKVVLSESAVKQLEERLA